jgi:hypothetical protein
MENLTRSRGYGVFDQTKLFTCNILYPHNLKIVLVMEQSIFVCYSGLLSCIIYNIYRINIYSIIINVNSSFYMTSDRNEVTAADNPITNQCEHSGISKHPEAACVFNIYSSCLNMNYLINFNL